MFLISFFILILNASTEGSTDPSDFRATCCLITELKTQLKSLQIEYNDDFSIEEMKVMTDTVIQRAYNEPNKLKNKKS